MDTPSPTAPPGRPNISKEPSEISSVFFENLIMKIASMRCKVRPETKAAGVTSAIWHQMMLVVHCTYLENPSPTIVTFAPLRFLPHPSPNPPASAKLSNSKLQTPDSKNVSLSNRHRGHLIPATLQVSADFVVMNSIVAKNDTKRPPGKPYGAKTASYENTNMPRALTHLVSVASC